MRTARVLGLFLGTAAILLLEESRTPKASALSAGVTGNCAVAEASSNRFPAPDPWNLFALGSGLVGMSCFGLMKERP